MLGKVKVYVKIHKNGREIVAICDKELMDLNNDFNTQTANPSHKCGCDRQGARCFNPPYYAQDEGFCNQTSGDTFTCIEYQ